MINEEVHKQIEEAYKLVGKANDKIFEIYVEHVLYTGLWWFGLFLSIVPWILWVIFRNKESTWRLLTVGFYVMLISSWLDIVGVTLDLWHYHFEIVPIIPAFSPWDSTLMPVTIMFFLQVKPSFSPLIKAIIFGIIAAFLAEPFFKWLGLYEPVHWKHIYSFIIYILIYLIASFISTRQDFKEIKNKLEDI